MDTTPGSAADDALVEQWYDDEERTILLRYLRLSEGDEFQIAATEVPTPAVRKALLRWLHARAPDRPLLEVSLKSLPGVVLVDELAAALAQSADRSPRAVLALTDLEEVRGAATETHPPLFMRLNLERDPLVQALPLTCLLLAHPAALLKLATVAPDFSHYFSTLVHHRRPTATAHEVAPSASFRMDPSPSSSLELSDSDWPTLLRAADHALARGEYDGARDCLSEFRATREVGEWEAECRLLEGALEGTTQGARAGLAVLAGVDAEDPGLRPAVVVRLLLKRSEIADILGERDVSDEHLEAAQRAADRCGRQDLRAAVLTMRASRLATQGAIDEALTLLEQARAIYEACDRGREVWEVVFRVAHLRGIRGEWDAVVDSCERLLVPMARSTLNDDRLVALASGLHADALEAYGEFDEALRIRRGDQIPVYSRLGDVRSLAVTQGRVAEILIAQGDPEEALNVLRSELIPVFERLGDARALAWSQGKIADILMARGDLDEALRIRREYLIPVYSRLNDVRFLAITQGQIGDILMARGDLDEALRIRREEEIPVYSRLGDVHSLAVTQSKIADILMTRGDLDQALRILRSELIPVFERLGDVYSLATIQGKIAGILTTRGDLDEALRIHREDQIPVYTRVGDVRSLAVTQGKIADILMARGDLDEALRIHREEEIPVYSRLGDVRELAVTQGKIADILKARGSLDEALRVRREEQIPVFKRIGDVRSLAVAQGKIADILKARGDLDEALRIYREEEIPVYSRLGDVRSLAWSQSKIADILKARGDLDEALRIRREEEIPVYSRLGDVHSLAVTQGKIADILMARGDSDEALRILRADLIPVFERLGDVRSLALTRGQIADVLMTRGDLNEALRIRREEVLPVLERLGDVRELLVARAILAYTLHHLPDPTPERAQEIATLLTSAYRDAVRLRIPEAASIRVVATRLGLALPDAQP